MFYANMYCYGMDINHVGITGIVSCLGVVFASPARLYAVHIPPNNAQRDLAGALSFCHMIVGQEGGNPGGSLHLFVNGTNRSQADMEARTIREGLGGPVTRVYRMMTNLGPNSGGQLADSATIRVRRNAGNLDLDFKHVPDDDWIAGGSARTGCYYAQMDGTFGDAIRPSALAMAGGWHPMTNATCHIRGIH